MSSIVTEKELKLRQVWIPTHTHFLLNNTLAKEKLIIWFTVLWRFRQCPLWVLWTQLFGYPGFYGKFCWYSFHQCSSCFLAWCSSLIFFLTTVLASSSSCSSFSNSIWYKSFLFWISCQKLSSLSFSGQTQLGLSYADPFLSNVLMADLLKMAKDWIRLYVVNFDKQFCISQDSWFWCLHNRILDIGKRSSSSIKMYNMMARNTNGSS